MKVVIVSNYFNHHQKPVCDSLNILTDGNFTFVATERISEWRKQFGYQEMHEDYVIDCTISGNRQKAVSAIYEADVVVTDAEDLSLTKQRYIAGKLIFRSSERLFKSRTRYLKAPIHFVKALKTKRMYLLCNSAYTALDFHKLGFYVNRSFKWGYFPAIKYYEDVDKLIKARTGLTLLWVGRLIKLKHPELAIEAACFLRKNSIPFTMQIIGDGILKDELEKSIITNGLQESVHLLGAVPSSSVRGYMEKASIFLFTSDRNEGWGAVLNESMNSACAVIANRQIGAAPFLIEHGINGLCYSSKEKFLECVRKLALDQVFRNQLSKAAYFTICNVWNANTAAKNLLILSDSLLNNRKNPIDFGPCSLSE